MKNLLSILLFLAFQNVFGQDAIMQKEIDFTKKEAQSAGFEFVQHLDGESNNNVVLSFDQQLFDQGYTYYVVLFVQDCDSCKTNMRYWNYNSEKFHELNTLKLWSDGYARTEYSFSMKIFRPIRLEVYADTDSSKFSYAMVFRKPN